MQLARSTPERSCPPDLTRAWPPVVVPAVAYLAWQIYIHLQAPPAAAGVAKVGATAATPLPSVTDILTRVQVLLQAGSGIIRVWEVVYLGLLVLGAGAAVLLARRGSAAGVAALLFAGVMLLISVPDQWSLTRYTAPVFAMLLLAGLEQRSRLARGVCVTATALTAFLPWLILGL